MLQCYERGRKGRDSESQIHRCIIYCKYTPYRREQQGVKRLFKMGRQSSENLNWAEDRKRFRDNGMVMI